jgi:hypothetical protein
MHREEVHVEEGRAGCPCWPTGEGGYNRAEALEHDGSGLVVEEVSAVVKLRGCERDATKDGWIEISGAKHTSYAGRSVEEGCSH